ncbi:hypothetical protein [Actinomycetospora cinnamomea]|uniref:Uncharacterized protein n=1 Tax=Actinomycetospora cinnamomea TaxID=663609 RepID=A0A2U1FAB4_9PSEU|nr:hypothetical protein [Actinomycetospora cinnamomea]PVZ09125.1 hypothetical protein C8D89_107289 [Actinomycetospora cinnamomea]
MRVDNARTALGQASALPADVAATFVGFFHGLAGMLARRADPGESTHAYRLLAPAGTVSVVPGGDVALPVCTITGPNDAIALFCMGRTGSTTNGLRSTRPSAPSPARLSAGLPAPDAVAAGCS